MLAAAAAAQLGLNATRNAPRQTRAATVRYDHAVLPVPWTRSVGDVTHVCGSVTGLDPPPTHLKS